MAASARRAWLAFSSASFFALSSSGVSAFSSEPSQAFQLDLPATESLKPALFSNPRAFASVHRQSSRHISHPLASTLAPPHRHAPVDRAHSIHVSAYLREGAFDRSSIENSHETRIRARARRHDAPSDDGSVGAELHARADGNDVGGHGDHGAGVETMRHELPQISTRGGILSTFRGEGCLDES